MSNSFSENTHAALGPDRQSSDKTGNVTKEAGFEVDLNYGGLLAEVLQSNMVIQQGKPFTLWGNASPGEKIEISADWLEKRITAEANEKRIWKIVIDVPFINPGDFTPHSITIFSGKREVRLDNLLIGEVWFMSGQSNMAMSMKPFLPWHKGVVDYDSEIAEAHYPFIRLYKQAKNSSLVPQSVSSGKWQECSPETVADFSAVSYYFAKKLFEQINIPIGIVLSALGGMSCQSFTPAETLQQDETLKHHFWDTWISNPELEETKRPSHLYNGMIHPFIHLSIRGFGWYQGESNAGHRELYTLLCSEMIKAWRLKFNQGELPFYLVQMTPYSWKGKDFYNDGYAYFREAQEKIIEITPKTDIVSTMDVGEADAIHPSDKKPVGERLAALALYHDYKVGNVPKGPVYSRMEIMGPAVRIFFSEETVGSGLTTKDGKNPDHFYVAGSDSIFYLANAVIKNNTIELKCEQVKEPVAVRYAFLTYPLTNLQNKEGFAAYPFRTDSRANVKYNNIPK